MRYLERFSTCNLKVNNTHLSNLVGVIKQYIISRLSGKWQRRLLYSVVLSRTSCYCFVLNCVVYLWRSTDRCITDMRHKHW